MIRVPRGAPRAPAPLAVPLLENRVRSWSGDWCVPQKRASPGPPFSPPQEGREPRGPSLLRAREAERPPPRGLWGRVAGRAVSAEPLLWTEPAPRSRVLSSLPWLPRLPRPAQDRVREPGSPRLAPQPPPGRQQAACGACGCRGPRCLHRRSSDKQTFPAEEPTLFAGGPGVERDRGSHRGARGAARGARVHTEGLLWTKADAWACSPRRPGP